MVDQNLTCYLENPHWTLFERQFKSFESKQCENATNLYKSITQKMENSFLSSFLYHLNKTQAQQTFIQQDKLERIQFDIEKGLVDITKLESSYNICDDLFGLIELYLRNSITGKMTVKEVLKSMKILRVTGIKIGEVDSSLCSLRHLEVLVLAGNCLSSCPGVSLPRGLMVLELCSNRLDNISSLGEHPPPSLLYLGLARNRLTSGVLEPLKNFEFLYHLDLAQNNIDDLTHLIITCSQMANLSSLMLIGNPCSMSPNYFKYITSKIPKLIFLDGELLKKDGHFEEENELECKGSLQLYLFRVMGIPQPKNEKVNKKKVTHSFRLEFESPLLQQYLMKMEDSFIIDESLVLNEEVKKYPKKDNKNNKNDSIKESLSEKKGTKAKKGKKNKSVNQDDTEISKTLNNVKTTADNRSSDLQSIKRNKLTENNKQEENLKTLMFIEKEREEVKMYQMQLKSNNKSSLQRFKSERKTWGRVIEFDEPTVEVSNCDLWSLRDVFRTDLTLQLVHLMTLPPVSKVKNKTRNRGKDNLLEKNIVYEEDADKEILISKSTLAQFKVPLQDIVWSKQYLEYIWTINNPFVVDPTTDLKNLQYAVNKKKERRRTKGEDQSKGIQLPIPSTITCHIGIGVKRV